MPVEFPPAVVEEKNGFLCDAGQVIDPAPVQAAAKGFALRSKT